MTNTSIIDFLNLLSIDYESMIMPVIKMGDQSAIRTKGKKQYRKNYERSILLLALHNKFNSSKFLELGTGRGYVSWCLAELGNFECIHTVDKDVSMAEKFLSKYSNTTIHECDANSFDYKRINERFDLFFIDAQHDYESILLNTSLCKKLAKKNYIIVYDDYRNKFSGVKKAIDSIDFDKKVLVHTDGWLIPNSMIKEAKDADLVIKGREHGSGMVVCFSGDFDNGL